MDPSKYNIQVPFEPKSWKQWPTATPMQLYRDTWWYSRKPFPSSKHLCATSKMSDRSNSGLLETALLTDDVRQAYLSNSIIKDTPVGSDRSDTAKMLFDVCHGMRMPKIVRCSSKGDSVILDLQNKRVQVFNSFCIWKFTFGEKELKAPVTLCVTDDKVLVSESSPPSVRLYTLSKGVYKGSIKLAKVPEAMCHFLRGKETLLGYRNNKFQLIDDDYRIVGKFRITFDPPCDPTQMILATHDDDKFLLTRADHPWVYCFDKFGAKIFSFELLNPFPGLSVCPIDFCSENEHDFLVADGLNHMIVRFDIASNKPANVVLSPKDDVGSLKSICISSEGHLCTTECSLNDKDGDKLKIFKHLPCACHTEMNRQGKLKDESKVWITSTAVAQDDWLIETKAVTKFVPHWLKTLHERHEAAYSGTENKFPSNEEGRSTSVQPTEDKSDLAFSIFDREESSSDEDEDKTV